MEKSNKANGSNMEKKQKKTNKTRNSKKAKKEILRRALLILLLIIIIIVVSMYVVKLDKENTKKDYQNYNFYQYFSGRKIEYEGSIESTKKEGIQSIKSNTIDIQLDSTPIYYKDTPNKVIFPEEMQIIRPMENGQTYKINKFSNLYINENAIYLEYNGNIKEITDSFIYDGSDLYFFISDATLTIDDKTYEITPLSYVKAYDKSIIEIYNMQKDEYTIVETQNQAILQTEQYSLNLNTDTLKCNENTQLLLHNMKDLKAIDTVNS